eukprot:CAMPEP_0201522194 /NCGR_PEP_ID=MMETSP0161_2-20130828/16511_1 /ASSEMBLY_ACC=CAM_ASM_000251 /TAXON_ID=180227 /ORGANISM="Neoparamoeba aestuarina, Strain SoJaBio B1-5/56/2" /LENGTH=236 /DNA_ID=CAMNT_0047920969 /DNA_START=64 /DNA_END=774 /DNA_ORIENTATION=-
MANYGYGQQSHYPPQQHPGMQPMGQSFAQVPAAGGPQPGYNYQQGMGASMPGAPPPTFQGWAASYYYQLQPQEIQKIKVWFQSVDQDRSGSISVHELQNVAFGGIPLGFDTSVKLIKVFDKDYSGTIDFYEYAALHKFIESMQMGFTRADANRNGQLDANEIHAALYQSGFVVGLPGVQALFRKYAKGRHGIGFSDYLGLVADVALLRTKFEWADTRRQGFIQINLDTLIVMAADL